MFTGVTGNKGQSDLYIGFSSVLLLYMFQSSALRSSVLDLLLAEAVFRDDLRSMTTELDPDFLLK